MLIAMDIHAGTGRLAVQRSDASGKMWLELRTLAGEELGEVPPEFLPLRPHWSPNGSAILFGSNDGRLFCYRLGDRAPRLIFGDPQLNAGFGEWAPDGQQVVFSAHENETGRPPSLYRLAVSTGRTQRLTHEPRQVDRFPHWSPAGQWVAFQRQNLDEAEIPPRIYVLDAQTGECWLTLNTPGGGCHTGRYAWRADESALLVTHHHGGGAELRAIQPRDQATTWRYSSPTLKAGAFSPGGEAVLAICTDELLWFAYPSGTLSARLPLAGLAPVRVGLSGPNIGFDQDPAVVYFLAENSGLYRWRLGGDVEIVLDEPPPARPTYRQEAYTVLSRDGRAVPVQRFIPPQPNGPAILYVHGGPGGLIDPNDPFMLRLLAEGIEFVCAAYRGSEGYGPEHADANRGEYGRADVWDVIAAARDWKSRLGPDRPLFLAGYSYGGFLTLLALAQADNPCAGGITLYAVSGLHRMSLHQHKALSVEAEERARAMVERSPLEQAGRIRAPLLMLHGARDTAASTEELEAIRDRVRAAGGVCELVVYADDTHGLRRHRDDVHRRVMAFVSRF